MKDMFMHLAWFTLVSCALAYGVFFVAGKMVYAQSAGQYDAVPIRDELAPGAHHLSGIVMVDQTCDELHDTIEQVSATTYEISFTTFQEPAVNCDKDPTPRDFRDTLFAPSTGVDFIATMDGQSLLVAVMPVIQH